MRQHLVDEHDVVVGRVLVRRSGESHLVWDSGDRFVCCWGESGSRAEPTFKLWTYRAYENRHEFYEGELARLVAMQYWSCVEYSEGTKEQELPTYLSRDWWERWRAETDDSDSDRRSSHRRRHGRAHPYRRPAKTAGMGRVSSDSSTSDSAPSAPSSPPIPARYQPRRQVSYLDPHVNERLRRLESALMWHSNILERIVGCTHHACPHTDPEAAKPSSRVGSKVSKGKEAEACPPDRDPDLKETLDRLESVSGDIDRRLRTVHLCEGCA